MEQLSSPGFQLAARLTPFSCVPLATGPVWLTPVSCAQSVTRLTPAPRVQSAALVTPAPGSSLAAWPTVVELQQLLASPVMQKQTPDPQQPLAPLSCRRFPVLLGVVRLPIFNTEFTLVNGPRKVPSLQLTTREISSPPAI